MSVAVTIGIDPGIDMCGVAEFCDGVLSNAWLIRTRKLGDSDDLLVRTREMAEAVSDQAAFPACGNARVVIEWPRVYLPGKSRGNNNDLLLLAAVAGAISALAMRVIPFCDVESVTPEEWRYGQVRKNIAFSRVVDRLSEHERRALGDLMEKIPASYREHVEDAVGIGMYALGRLKPTLVI